HQVQRVEDVDIPPEKDVDLGRAAARSRAYVGNAGHYADGLLERTRHREHLYVHGRDAVLSADRNTRKIGLWKDGDGQAENENDAGEREAQHDQQQRPAMRLDEVRQAPGHGSFCAFSPLPASLPAPPVLTWA